MSTTSIPYACYGTSVSLAQKISKRTNPEYDLVHGCFTLDTATAELPDSFAGCLDNAEKAHAPIGSNSLLPKEQRRAPRALIIGGAVPDDHWDTVKAAIMAKAPGTKMIAIRWSILTAEGFNPAMSEDEKADLIAKIIRRKMVEKGVH